MNLDNFLKNIYKAYTEELDSRNDDDYVVNSAQLQKLNKAYAFFKEVADECGGIIEMEQITPKEKHCGLTVYCKVFYFYLEKLSEFTEILNDSSGVSIDVEGDDVCISLTIPNVFIEKTCED